MSDYNDNDQVVETKALSTVITPEHMSIGDSFLGRVKLMISARHIEIMSYAVDVAQSAYSSDTESMKLKIDDKTTLIVTLMRNK